ncbi:MAG: hypothetical protein JNG88_04880 [Phycisphaerales bacterium]|nr:hypothetical protein [Phycisphaerales bacterium]
MFSAPMNHFRASVFRRFVATASLMFGATLSLAQDFSPIRQITLRNDTGGPVNDLHITYDGRPPGGTLLNPGGRQNRGYGGVVGGSEYREWPDSQGWSIANGGVATLEWREGITARRARHVVAADWTLNGDVVGPATVIRGQANIAPGVRRASAQFTNDSAVPLLFQNIRMVRDNSIANFTEESFDLPDGFDVTTAQSVIVMPGTVEEVQFGDVGETGYQFVSAEISTLDAPDVRYLSASAAMIPEPATLVCLLFAGFALLRKTNQHAS